ncbi:protein CHROMATIN REMODELING 25 [Senna tora]|uniref:Protein CHROMATIN REMODELING 25 n=1 Tax=Senna tora TaxID=362788 RepID=A0A834SVR1_9FABA|nr:protein CHROMATIN REMODELING 25 [Senna tora]
MEDEDDLEAVSCSSDSDDDYAGECEQGLDEEDRLEADLFSPPDDERKSKNVDALVRGNLVVKTQSLLPRVLSVTAGAAICRKPFKPPCSNGYNGGKEELTRRLWARKKFVPWGSNRPVLVEITNHLNTPINVEKVVPEEKVSLPPGIDPLVLWQPEDYEDGGHNLTPIEVDPLLVHFLRPHQREGVQFMFECVSGLCTTADIHGCILADDMGLGKTLQSITLLYTLLCQGFDGKPMVKKAIIVTPTSLVSNWEAEIKKWVGERIQLVALCESTRDDVICGIDNFTSPHSSVRVLIVSYETFRMHSSKFSHSDSCDLLICDEAHRLKNDQTITNRALAALSCKRRVLLSGTPLQNDLEEFFAMVNFTNPGILGDIAHFRRYFEAPIIGGREPTATAQEKKLGAERSAELSAKVNQIVEVVCCKLTPLQSDLYKHFIQSKNVKRAIVEEVKQSKILAYITALKKLCNHPKLIYDTIRSGSPGTSGFEDCIRFFPSEMLSGRSGSWNGGGGAWVELSGKMHVLARLLAQLRQKTNDRIVLVSNYTQTLDLFAQLCRERRYPHLRLDGNTSINKRQKLVNHFNDQSKDQFVFLLSSKAGGCGLNLIGGNRLVLFDPDWNPANDKQAAARVWRDGQKKRVYIYRFLSAGTIEEKVYQRQMSKEGLQKVIQQEQTDNIVAQGNFLSTEELRDLFTYHESVNSEIHEKMQCARCQTYYDRPQNTDGEYTAQSEENNGESDEETSDIGGFAEISGCLQKLKRSEKQVGTPLEEDLRSWGHHFFPTSVPDAILQASAGDEVTFVFTNQVNGKLVPIDSTVSPKLHQEESSNEPLKPKQNVKSNPCLSLHQKLPLKSASSVAVTSSISTSSVSTKPSMKSAILNSIGINKNISSTNAALKAENSLVNQLPQKRSCPVYVFDEDEDDDLE